MPFKPLIFLTFPKMRGCLSADPAHPEHAERREWLGEDFDPDDFNPEIADAILAARFSRA